MGADDRPSCADLPPLRLLAQDEDDLAILSAALQNAVIRRGDISWERRGRRLTARLTRFRWEADAECARVLAAVQLGDVSRVRARGMPKSPDAMLELLAVSYEPEVPPGGAFTFMFAGGADLQADVECIDAVLADLTESWPARAAPAHEEALDE
ncbi:DUF2948 family protein [Brevundimonas aveniformis]|uniref:DUF2948 family protein n=1 Tax=Brevundimonas aveniformis TaxID=370977 RepID=UPI00040BCFFC|nr:DUF2948 family protein [Brevundimonas aveniformis]